MSKILIIVESKAKTEKIKHILGPKFECIASLGHFIDLDPKSMSIDIENNFTPNYVVIAGKTEVLKNLKYHALKIPNVLIGSDTDREGAAIAWSIAKELKLKNPKRILFTEITKAELTQAIANPVDIDMNIVAAQQARRMLDRIVGYKLSPLLNKHLKQGNLSAGRVQSPIIKLIIDRENEIKEFFKNDINSFFKFATTFISNKPNDKLSLDAQLYTLDGTTKDKTFKGLSAKIETETTTRTLFKLLQESIYKVENVFTKKRTQGPQPPFKTSTLQQEGSRKFGFTPKRTMQVAQKLYENGYITYMRTDSVNLSEEAHQNIKKYILNTYGENHYRRVNYKNKTNNAQEAHEAIRPCDVATLQDDIELGADEVKLYGLIWKRAIASQMAPAEFDVLTIQISIDKTKEYFFMTTIEKMTFTGYLKVYNIATVEKDDVPEDVDEPQILDENMTVPKKGDVLLVHNMTAKQNYNKPPGRYNNASLVSIMDEDHINIGRPATTANFVDKIVQINYARIDDIKGFEKKCLILEWDNTKKKLTTTPNKNNNKQSELIETTNTILLGAETKKFVPTELAIMVNKFLVKHFSNIMDYKFTAKMEEKLDKIAKGTLKLLDVMKEFYDGFAPIVDKLTEQAPVVENKFTRYIGDDPESGNKIYATLARYGPVVKICTRGGKYKYGRIKDPLTIETVTLKDALKLLQYPKELGKLDKKLLTLNKGEFGLYLIHNKIKYTVGEDNEENRNISLTKALEIINNKKKSEFRDAVKIYTIKEGPYGKYIHVQDINQKGKKFNVGLPPNENVEKITLERIIEILKKKYETYKQQMGVKKTTTKEAPVKKTPVKKTPVKKTPVKKTPVKKTPVKKTPVKKTPVKKVTTAIKTKPTKKVTITTEDVLIV